MDMDIDAFSCRLCDEKRDFCQLCDLGCSCLVCQECAGRRLTDHMDNAAKKVRLNDLRTAVAYSLGQLVWYRQADGCCARAKVLEVDKSMQPPQYGIQLHGSETVRWTEGIRLMVPPDEVTDPSASHTVGSRVWYLQGCGTYCQAVVEQVDRTMDPPQIGIKVTGSDTVRYTEVHRITSLAPQPKNAITGKHAGLLAVASCQKLLPMQQTQNYMMQ